MRQANSNSTDRDGVIRKDSGSASPLVMEHVGKVKDMNREFDVTFWQAQDAATRFRAAWEQVEFYYAMKGLPKDELRLHRSVESLQRQSG